MSQYGIDLENFSLERFRQTLESDDLLPSRKILKENIAGRFAALEDAGIINLQQLIDALSTKKKRESFAQKTGLSTDYLTILRRQARSYIPTPVHFKDIPEVDPDVVERLAAAGIKHSKHLFERAGTRAQRAELCQQTGIPADTLRELIGLSDLARAGWVGPVFVRMIYETGTDTLEKLAQQQPEDLYQSLLAVNAARQFTKAVFSLKDAAACIETAQALPKVIEY